MFHPLYQPWLHQCLDLLCYTYSWLCPGTYFWNCNVISSSRVPSSAVFINYGCTYFWYCQNGMRYLLLEYLVQRKFINITRFVLTASFGKKHDFNELKLRQLHVFRFLLPF